MRAGDGNETVLAILERACELRRRHGWEALIVGTFYSFSSVYRKRGWLLVLNGGDGRKRYRLSAAALAARSPASPWAAVRGEDLEREEYRGYRKIEDGETT